MKGIGGNITAVIQTATTTKNAIGEQVKSWADAQTLKGWLDLQTGDSRYTTYNAKIQESTHVFIADYVLLADGIQAENSRMTINGKVYDILLIDNPMEMGSGSQLEIYLRFTGGQ
jgi:head-tail adaptor